MRRTHLILLAALVSTGAALGPVAAAATGSSPDTRCAPLAAQAATHASVAPGDSVFVGRVVFVTFADSRSGLLPAYADALPEELARYLAAESRGRWRTDVRLVRRGDAPDSAWRAPRPAAEYAGLYGLRFWMANREVLAEITARSPGEWDGVDQVWMIHDQCTFPCSDNRTRDTCEDTCPYGGISTLGLADGEIAGLAGGGTTQRRYTRASEVRDHAIQSSFAVHEFGHRIRSAPHAPGSDARGEEWVNFGRYDVLRSGVNGAGAREEGLLPYSPLHLARWGWLPVLRISGDSLDVRLPDVMGPRGQLVEVATRSTRQRFLLAHHAGSTPYDARYGGEGLLVWHVTRDSAGNDVRWDLEAAGGRFSGGAPDPVGGRDALEADPLSLGSAADFFAAGAATVLDHASNPSSRLHERDDIKSLESVPSGVAIEHLRRDPASGDLLVDIWVSPAQRLLEPQAGTRLEPGTPLTVRWEPRVSARVTDASIEYTADDGRTWSTLATGLANSGLWQDAAPPSAARARVRLVSRDSSGVTGTSLSGVFEIAGADPPLPASFAFAPPAPNPSRGATRFDWTLAASAPVSLTVHDAHGRLVRRLVSAELVAGPASAEWDGRDAAGRLVPAGLYLARLEAGGQSRLRRVVRLGPRD